MTEKNLVVEFKKARAERVELSRGIKLIQSELKAARAERRELREDVDNLAITTKNSFDRVDARFDRVESEIQELLEGYERLEQKQDEFAENLARLERGIKAILEVVQENNILLKEFRTHPERIARLERAVFGSTRK